MPPNLVVNQLFLISMIQDASSHDNEHWLFSVCPCWHFVGELGVGRLVAREEH